ncbi:MAG: TOMM precursor leader peptide-binding protein [Chloroflexi bacterium]|nr:TOMM precursor leader peptide-binding protein [Chloroflexota bacterium]
MNTHDSAYYVLAAGIDAVPLNDGSLLCRSDTLALRIEGAFARVLAQRVLPLLNGQRSFEQIAGLLPDLPREELRQRLDELVQAQVLNRQQQPQATATAHPTLAPLLAMLETIGLEAPVALQTLQQLRIVIVGLEAHGAQLAALLADCGVGSLVLVDPFPCQPGNLSLMPLVGPEAIGVAREQALQTALQARGVTSAITIGGAQELTKERVAALATDAHLLVGCFDKGFSATNHWINRASLAQNIPALYAELRGHTALIGPAVLPGQTACYMCYRMRSIACEEDFNAAMSYEEFLDHQKRPALHERGVLPMLPPYVGSLLALEILKQSLSLSLPALTNNLLEFNALTMQTTSHPILQKPDCPVCGEKKNWIRSEPLMAELRQEQSPPGDLLAVDDQLVSRKTGIVRNLMLIKQDTSEPARPLVIAAEIANHRFLEHEPKEQRMCSGKGLTSDAARISTLGEAVERYSGACWDYSEITYGRRREIDGATLDPRDLVLYNTDQYARLPYQPYTGENILGWTRGRSLVTGEQMFVPALAIYLNYDMRAPNEFLCPITSNGLATGATLADAILAATCEVLERDAFMIAWFNRMPGQRVDPLTHPDADMRELCAAYGRRNVEMRIYRVPVDHPCHVFASVALQLDDADAPAVVVGLGADLDASRAARKAMLEIGQVRPTLRKRMRDPEQRRRMEELVADPHLVKTLDDHDLLYASRQAIGALDFLLKQPSEPFDWQGNRCDAAPIDRLERLVAHGRAEGWDLIYVNLTPPDMQKLGLYTVRAILPDFQPIHFGWKEPRLAGQRLYDLPRRLGYSAARTTPAQLNDDPHPLA